MCRCEIVRMCVLLAHHACQSWWEQHSQLAAVRPCLAHNNPPFRHPPSANSLRAAIALPSPLMPSRTGAAGFTSTRTTSDSSCASAADSTGRSGGSRSALCYPRQRLLRSLWRWLLLAAAKARSKTHFPGPPLHPRTAATAATHPTMSPGHSAPCPGARAPQCTPEHNAPRAAGRPSRAQTGRPPCWASCSPHTAPAPARRRSLRGGQARGLEALVQCSKTRSARQVSEALAGRGRAQQGPAPLHFKPTCWHISLELAGSAQPQL